MIVLGIIPARGGSKSIPLKNIKPLCRKPLLAYTIESALQSNSINRLVVSTDHPQIAQIAQEYGSEVIMRPAELATDDATTESVLLHVLEVLENRDKYIPDVVLTLEPTAPFRTVNLIEKCINIFNLSDADSVIGVVESRSCYGKIVDKQFEFLFPGQLRRRQLREPLYKECSTIYATRVSTLRNRNSVLGEKLYALIVPEEEAIDINTNLDFKIAEALMQAKVSAKEEIHD